MSSWKEKWFGKKPKVKGWKPRPKMHVLTEKEELAMNRALLRSVKDLGEIK